MNAVEIEQAITDLAEQPFDPAEFPYAFLEAFGNKATTIKRLRAGASNKSDLGGVLQTSNIHILTCEAGRVTQTLAALKASPATAKAKAKFILATDGVDFEAEDLTSGETVACAFKDFPDHFGFFLPLAGISTVRQISENAFDIRATSRLNRLYVELLKDNPEWGAADRRHDMNKFMARLIFCFFAEDTDIFIGKGRFTETVAQMSAKDSSNTHEVLAMLFRTMNTKREDRAAAKIPRWAEDFPYVNGQLFSGGDEVPRFSKIARSYLLHVGGLDWTKINPDIFGSMIQAVAEDEERGELGMHYTSVPNILKVLNPLFLDDLRAKLEEAGDNARVLLNLRKRIAKIRVFDPACGSGNFLVIAYKEMRAIEAEINQRRGEPDRASEIPLTNFRGIELRDFPAEIARLALVIAEYQCDVLYRGQKLALAEFLPLRNENWITCGNALRLDWLKLMDADQTGVKLQADSLFGAPLDQAEIDFENEGGETYICGNPPYLGGKTQTPEQKAELADVFGTTDNIGELDYVAGWLLKGAQFSASNHSSAAFVVTNSLNQGAQVHQLWPRIFALGIQIFFAHKDFKWSNNATRNAAVICSVIGINRRDGRTKRLFTDGLARDVDCIGPYLVPGRETIVEQALTPVSDFKPILTGNSPYDGGNLLLSSDDRAAILSRHPEAVPLIRRLYGSKDYLNGELRYCLWIDDANLDRANGIEEIRQRISKVRASRLSGGQVARGLASRPHQFRYTHRAKRQLIIVPRVSSERRPYIPFGLLDDNCVVSDSAQAIYDADLWNLAVLLSMLHMAWVRAVAGRLKTDLRYSSALCYNTFPLPTLTEKNKADLTRCAEDILVAREHHFPATMAELYDPENMPADLRAAHDRNDEVLERIYIGRRFKNDTERLEKLFDLYTKMTASAEPAKGKKSKAGANA
ncbi:class I SAM-dependent DNA methyltransferase [Pseudomonas aeruginosa]|uniref:class I SAM-dependent DNA methyltransferase n=1 Tax=Pseudomonas aeruginosa TaxID=287 RepID=UPI0009F919D7|nr:class I SAM-dependent DNA methyltransferase [Pseudomonas aeruginosa]HCE0206080.1 class I SAM-dependent DNA methyltransferase [Pseudomonas aeruginosa]HCL4152172.1 class I SAM-dependent DNA methyltransferase [Pseudomonas aeruginosa]